MERRTIPEGMFDGELYDGELPPGQEESDDLPPGVHDVSEEEAVAAEQRFVSNSRRHEARVDAREASLLVEATKAGKVVYDSKKKDTSEGSSKPSRMPENKGYSRKAQRDAHRQRRADEGRRNS